MDGNGWSSASLFSKSLIDDAPGRGVDPRIGDRIEPSPELGVQVIEIAEVAAEEKIFPDIAEAMCLRTVFLSDSELARYRGRRDALTMQFQDHDNFPEFDHRALPPANGSSIGQSARRPAFQGMPWKAGRHENWGIFNRHIWGVYVRHSQMHSS